MTTFLLVRHGQSTWNLTRRLQGQTVDVPLTELGREQAQAAATTLSRAFDGHAEAIWSSDLRRARQTAAPIAARLGLPVHIHRGLREQGYGILEGRSTAEVLADNPYDFSDPDAHAPGGESIRQVYDRIAGVLTQLTQNHHPDASCVIVTHGDVIRIALAWLDGAPAEAVPWREVPNGSITRVVLPRPSAPGRG